MAMRIVLACVESSWCRDEECYRAYCVVKTFERGYCLDKTKRSYEDRSERRFHNGISVGEERRGCRPGTRYCLIAYRLHPELEALVTSNIELPENQTHQMA